MAVTRSPHLWPPSHPGRRDLLWTDCWTCWRGQSQTPPMKTTEGTVCVPCPPPPHPPLFYRIQWSHAPSKSCNIMTLQDYKQLHQEHIPPPCTVNVISWTTLHPDSVYYYHIPPSVISYNNHPLIMYRWCIYSCYGNDYHTITM